MRRGYVVLVIAVAGAVACAHGDDGFRALAAAGCTTEMQCQSLSAQARARLRRCEADGEHCQEQQYDAQFVDTQLAAWRSARELASRSRKLDEVEAERASCNDELATLKTDVENRDKRSKALQTAIGACAVSDEYSACNGLDESGTTTCREWCSARVTDVRMRLYDAALSQCVGSRASACVFPLVASDGTSTAPFVGPADQSRCSTECARQTAAADPVLQVRRVARPASRSGSSGGPSSGGSGGGGTVRCCDGTNSPTCTYVHRGCCSHHGGVCGG